MDNLKRYIKNNPTFDGSIKKYKKSQERILKDIENVRKKLNKIDYENKKLKDKADNEIKKINKILVNNNNKQ